MNKAPRKDQNKLNALYQEVGRATDIWANVEEVMFAIYSSTLASQNPEALSAAYHAIHSFQGKLDMVDAVVKTAYAQGIRDDYVVLVGGAPLNEEFSKAIGADAYCRDAAVAVETAKDFMQRKHNKLAAG